MSEGGPTLEDRLDNLAERINDIAIRVTREGVVEHITRNACQRLGVEQEEVIGRNLSELLHPDDRQQTLLERPPADLRLAGRPQQPHAHPQLGHALLLDRGLAEGPGQLHAPDHR